MKIASIIHNSYGSFAVCLLVLPFLAIRTYAQSNSPIVKQLKALTNQPNVVIRRPGQLIAPGAVVSKSTVSPTVTSTSGDLGGKFFGQSPDPAKTRRYFIAAETVGWDYNPQKQEPVCGNAPVQPAPMRRPSNKLRYIQYTDGNFNVKVKEDAGLGILGPVLRGVVGEYLEVTFLNRTSRPLSMHPHGVRYDKDSEGAYYQPNPGLGSAVGSNATFTYVWKLDENSGPNASEPSSKCWLYHSHVSGDEESGMGLIGLIIVTDPKRARPDGTPIDVDRELATLFMIFDESGAGGEAAEEANRGRLDVREWAMSQMRHEQGSRYAINGQTYCSLSGLEANQGERIRWYLFALGSEQDFHTPHWHGLTVLDEGKRRTDVLELLPATMKTADMIADNPGNWLFHCHVAEHMQGGMTAHFIVHGKDKPLDQDSFQPFLGMSKAVEVPAIIGTTLAAPSR